MKEATQPEVRLAQQAVVTTWSEARTFRQRHPVVWRLGHHPVGLAGTGIMLIVCTLVVLSPVVAPHDPLLQHLDARFAGVGQQGYLLGTDSFGRDMLSRLLWGGRISLAIGFIAGAISLSIGVPLGMVAGYRGGWVDKLTMRLVDIFLAFPYILLAIVIVGSLGPGLRNTLIAVAVTNIPFSARLIRGIVLTVKHQQFVEASVATGASEFRVLRTAILPAILPYVVVSFTVSVGWLIIAGASLSFLGLGAQPPAPEWGAMLAESRQYLAIAPHTVLLPGMMLLLTAVGLNLLGDGLRDALDVTLKE